MRAIIILCIFIVVSSCALELERENPLDPQGNGSAAPDRVLDFEIPQTSTGYVQIEWRTQTDAAWYRIYRSLSYNGNYIFIQHPLYGNDESYIGGEVDYFEDLSEELVSETYYYYKISAVTTRTFQGLTFFSLIR